MRLTQCANGHFYDAEKYASCPHCNAVAGAPKVGGYGQRMAGPQGNNGLEPTGAYGTVPGNTSDAATVGMRVGNNGPAPFYSQETEGNKTVPMMVWRHSSEEERKKEAEESRRNVQPVVGWLVCVEGSNYGRSFPLYGGRNFIGRSQEMDVCLAGDMTVSSIRHAVLIYEPVQREFFVQPGDTRELFYLNEKAVLESKPIQNRDRLTVGKTTLVFVPFCDAAFGWED